jgi:TonB family protein
MQNNETAPNCGASPHQSFVTSKRVGYKLGWERGTLLTWQRILLIGCSAATLLLAQADLETVYDLGPGITPPRVVKQVNPSYPTNRGVKAVGWVIIGLVISSKGIPRDPHVVKGLDKDLDQSAVEAVKEWRFSPAQKNGKPIAVRVSVEIQFHEM